MSRRSYGATLKEAEMGVSSPLLREESPLLNQPACPLIRFSGRFNIIPLTAPLGVDIMWFKLLELNWVKLWMISTFMHVLLNLIFAVIFWIPCLFGMHKSIDTKRPCSFIDAFWFSMSNSVQLGIYDISIHDHVQNTLLAIHTWLSIVFYCGITALLVQKLARPTLLADAIFVSKRAVFTRFTKAVERPLAGGLQNLFTTTSGPPELMGVPSHKSRTGRISRASESDESVAAAAAAAEAAVLKQGGGDGDDEDRTVRRVFGEVTIRIAQLPSAKLQPAGVTMYIFRRTAVSPGYVMERVKVRSETACGDFYSVCPVVPLPITLTHDVDINSPLFIISGGQGMPTPDQVRAVDAQIVVIYEATDEEVGGVVVKRVCYGADQFVYGGRWRSMVTVKLEENHSIPAFAVDLAKLDPVLAKSQSM